MHLELERINQEYHYKVSNEQGLSVELDSAALSSEEPKGLSPMETVLSALAGCASIDVGMILKKQNQEVRAYKVDVRGDRREEVPRIFTDIHLHFHIYGSAAENKVERAIALSMEKYCSVTKMLEATVNIHTAYTVHP